MIDSTGAASRIGAHIRETPLLPSAALGGATGATVLLKLENRQDTGAFKLRGAANKLLSLTKEQVARGIVAASTGNHALAVATIAKSLGIPVEIHVACDVHPLKRRKIESLGARLCVNEGDAIAAELAARREAETSGRQYVSPYNDPVVVEGQGTVAVEILRQLPGLGAKQLDAIFVAVGGGGLIAGIGTHLKRVSPQTQVIGCWPENSDVMYRCLRAGEIREFPEKATWSTSTAGGIEPNAITLELCRRVIDRSVLVTEDEILAAARRVWREDKQRIEGAAAVAVAAFEKTAADYVGKTVAIVICGGNADPDFAAEVTRT